MGCDFMLFPLCSDGLSFARICKEDATYRSQVEAVYAALRDWAPDFLVAAGFHVLPPHAVTIPGQAALNFHPSKLPLYRGGLPFQAQILRGETRLECCVHVMTDIIDDAQDVLAWGVEISLEGKTTQQLFEEVGQLFPELVLEAIETIQQRKTRRAEAAEPSVVGQGDLPHSFGVKAETWIDETNAPMQESFRACVSSGRKIAQWTLSVPVEPSQCKASRDCSRTMRPHLAA